MQRITKIGVLQTSKVVGIIYFAISCVIVLPILIFGRLIGIGNGSGGFFGISLEGLVFVLAPFIYGIAGFVTTAIACIVYNYISNWTGGIEVQIADDYIDEPY